MLFLSITNPAWTVLGLNLSFHGGKEASNCQSYRCNQTLADKCPDVAGFNTNDDKMYL
jgi:hypothetical protein